MPLWWRRVCRGCALKEISGGADALAGALIKSLSDSYQNQGIRRMALSASIGSAQYPADAPTAKDIILCADAAMYQAKHLGKRRWVSYQNGIEQTSRRKECYSAAFISCAG